MNKHSLRLYNVLFPLWMILLFPQTWLVVLPGNLLIDGLILLLGLWVLKTQSKWQFFKKHLFKIYGFGLLADLVGAAYMLLCVFVFEWGTMCDELYITLPALLIAAVLIFVFNYFITFRKADPKTRLFFSLLFAIATAPYTYMVPSSWLY